MGQGLNLLLNMFFGPTINAARGIAYQVQTAISAFGSNFILTVKPQLINLYAKNNITQMMKLVFSSSRNSFFLIYFISLPLLLETPFVLELWLKIVPDHTLAFSRLVLINELIWSMRSPIVTSFHAVGHIKVANLVCGTLFYLIVILSYLGLRMGFPPESVFIISIGVSVMVQITELFLLKRFILFSVWTYAKEVVWICLLVVFTSGMLPYVLNTSIAPGFIRFFVVGFTSVLTVSISVFFIGIDKETQSSISEKIKIRFGS